VFQILIQFVRFVVEASVLSTTITSSGTGEMQILCELDFDDEEADVNLCCLLNNSTEVHFTFPRDLVVGEIKIYKRRRKY
jgi:hypothetical protein